jgi:hypothetical protein
VVLHVEADVVVDEMALGAFGITSLSEAHGEATLVASDFGVTILGEHLAGRGQVVNNPETRQARAKMSA